MSLEMLDETGVEYVILIEMESGGWIQEEFQCLELAMEFASAFMKLAREYGFEDDVVSVTIRRRLISGEWDEGGDREDAD